VKPIKQANGHEKGYTIERIKGNIVTSGAKGTRIRCVHCGVLLQVVEAGYRPVRMLECRCRQRPPM
jgi:hypothetical protein